MCGIAGYRAFGNERPTGEELTNLLIESEDRGRDATGVAFIVRDTLRIVKNGVMATEFVKSNEWKEVLTQNPLPEIMLLHCRQGTGGNPGDNRNNHPIFNKKGMALIHNGVITNYKELAKEKKIKLDGEVDSEIILKLIEPDWWGSIKSLNELSGGFACAAIYAGNPEQVVLFRHTNPIVFYMDKARDILFWASTKGILQAALTKYHRGFAFSSLSTFEMKDDTAILIDKEGLEKIVEISPKSYSSTCYQWDNEAKGWKAKGETRPQCGDFRGNTSGKKGKTKEETTAMETCDECRCRSIFTKQVGQMTLCHPCLMKYSRNGELYCSECYTSLKTSGYIDAGIWCEKCKKAVDLTEVRVWPMQQIHGDY
jgi:hypothetical protein